MVLSEVITSLVSHPLTEAILGQGGDIPPGGEIPPILHRYQQGGWYPPLLWFDSKEKGVISTPGGEIPPILRRSQHWRWYPPLPVHRNFLTNSSRIFSMCGVFEPFPFPFKTLMLFCLKFRMNLFQIIAEIWLQCEHFVSILPLSLHLPSSFLLVLSQDSTFHQFCSDCQRPTW